MLSWNEWGQRKPPLGVPLNRGHPDAKGMVNCWLFNEGSGGRVYDLAGGNTGTLTSMDPPTDWVPVEDGVGLDLDGTGDYILCDRPSVPVTNGLSIVVRLKFRVVGDWSTIFAWGVWLCPVELFRRAGTLQLSLGLADTHHYSTGSMTLNKWHTIVATWRPSWIDFYLDGVNIGSPACAKTSINAPVLPIRIGGEGVPYPCNAQISFAYQFNRFLTDSEAKRISSQPYAMFGRQRLWAVGAALTWRRRVIVAVPV